MSGVRHEGATIQGRRTTRPRDLQVGGRRPALVWSKRRWRDAYGFRNPVNQRLRTRCATTRKKRGHLDPR